MMLNSHPTTGLTKLELAIVLAILMVTMLTPSGLSLAQRPGGTLTIISQDVSVGVTSELDGGDVAASSASPAHETTSKTTSTNARRMRRP